MSTLPKKLCSIEGCHRNARARGWCTTHYERWRVHGSTGIPGGPADPAHLPGERWAAIPGYEGWYEASTLGRIKRVAHGHATQKGRVLSPAPNKHGYIVVELNKGGTAKAHSAHRLVMAAFAGPLPAGQQVNHKNTIKHDNRLENLEYCTPQENIAHAVANGLVARGEQNPAAVLTADDVRSIRQRYPSESYAALGAEYGVDPSTIHLVVKRHNWRHID